MYLLNSPVVYAIASKEIVIGAIPGSIVSDRRFSAGNKNEPSKRKKDQNEISNWKRVMGYRDRG